MDSYNTLSHHQTYWILDYFQLGDCWHPYGFVCQKCIKLLLFFFYLFILKRYSNWGSYFEGNKVVNFCRRLKNNKMSNNLTTRHAALEKGRLTSIVNQKTLRNRGYVNISAALIMPLQHVKMRRKHNLQRVRRVWGKCDCH